MPHQDPNFVFTYFLILVIKIECLFVGDKKGFLIQWPCLTSKICIDKKIGKIEPKIVFFQLHYFNWYGSNCIDDELQEKNSDE